MISIDIVLIALAVYVVIRLVVWFIRLPMELWADYLAVMNIMRVRNLARDGLGPPVTKWAYRVGKYFLIRAYLKDFIVNTFHLTFILREFPRWPQWSRRGQYPKFTKWLLKDGELTVSERLQRHIDTADSPHRERCLFLQSYWLSQYDVTGNHGTVTQLLAGQE